MSQLRRIMFSWGSWVRRALPLVETFGRVEGMRLALAELRRGVVMREVSAPSQPPVLCRLGIGQTDLRTLMHVLVDRDYEFPELKNPKFIIDAGANIGCAAVWFATKFPDAQIVALEPDPDNYQLLTHNTAQLANVTTLQMALAAHEGSTALVDIGAGPHSYRVLPTSAQLPANTSAVADVECTTIEALRTTYDVSTIDLLKLDIEGGEREVLGADRDCLANVGALVVELHDRWTPGCSRSYVHATEEFREEYVRGENTFAYR